MARDGHRDPRVDVEGDEQLAHVRRVEWMGTTGTPAFAARSLKSRWKLRGSTGSPSRVVKTKPQSPHMSPAASRRLASSTRCRSSARTAISGSGSGASEDGVFVWRRSSW